MPPGPAPALPCTHRLAMFRTAKVCPPLSSPGFDFLCSGSFQCLTPNIPSTDISRRVIYNTGDHSRMGLPHLFPVQVGSPFPTGPPLPPDLSGFPRHCEGPAVPPRLATTAASPAHPAHLFGGHGQQESLAALVALRPLVSPAGPWLGWAQLPRDSTLRLGSSARRRPC